jgi:hypothetical protein
MVPRVISRRPRPVLPFVLLGAAGPRRNSAAGGGSPSRCDGGPKPLFLRQEKPAARVACLGYEERAKILLVACCSQEIALRRTPFSAPNVQRRLASISKRCATSQD